MDYTRNTGIPYIELAFQTDIHHYQVKMLATNVTDDITRCIIQWDWLNVLNLLHANYRHMN